MSRNKKITFSAIILLLMALIFRIILSKFCRGFYSDINLFLGWAENMFKSGPENLYVIDNSCDYPPGYLYILWMIGGIVEWLKGIGADYSLTVLVLKLPAMICDVLTALLIYFIAKERQDERTSLLLMAIYLFNPAVLLNSTAWGQVDSVLALFVLLTVYLIYKGRMCLSYFAFCIGVLLKPQMIFLAPIVLLGIVDHVFVREFSVKKLLQHLFCGVGAVMTAVLLCLPFNLSHVIEQYTDTISSYPYASMNAYNFWSMLGMNWVHQDRVGLFGLPLYVWGYLFIVVICLIVFYIWYLLFIRKRQGADSYFLLATILIMGVFAFSVRMHERYMFPAMVLILAFCALNSSKKNYVLYAFISAVHFINVYQIYSHYYASIDSEYDFLEAICGAAVVGIVIYLLLTAMEIYKAKESINIKSFLNNDYVAFIAFYLLSFALCFFLPWVMKHLAGLTDVSFHDHFETISNISDVNSYIAIAENGYVRTGDARFQLVFFPFYPLVIKVVHLITRLDYRASATLISFVSAYWAAMVLYKTVLLDYSKDKAFNIIKFFLVSPFIFFTFTRMSEALYLFLLFTTIYFVRKEKYLIAGAFGFMTAATRLPGLAVGVIMLVEAGVLIYKDFREKDLKVKKYIKMFAMMLSTLCGFLSYLGINCILYKNPLEFLNLQQENWTQRFVNPIYTIKNVIIDTQLKGGYSLSFKIGCGVASLLAIIMIFISIAVAFKCRVRLSYIVYMIVYYVLCYSSSWLLSGARYSLGAFVIFIAGGLIASKNKYYENLITVGSTVLMIFYSFVCSIGGMY